MFPLLLYLLYIYVINIWHTQICGKYNDSGWICNVLVTKPVLEKGKQISKTQTRYISTKLISLLLLRIFKRFYMFFGEWFTLFYYFVNALKYKVSGFVFHVCYSHLRTGSRWYLLFVVMYIKWFTLLLFIARRLSADLGV